MHIEVPPPTTITQRVSILDVHMRKMYESGRIGVCDAPQGTVAAQRLKVCFFLIH